MMNSIPRPALRVHLGRLAGLIRLGLAGCVVMTAALPVSAQFASTFVDDDFVAPTPPNYDNIQDAIDNTDAGGTVNIAAGIYSPTGTSGVPRLLIPASKTGLRLLGAQADVDPRPAGGTTRTVIDGTTESIIEGNGSTSPTTPMLRNQASGVEINGLVVRNEGNADLIESLQADPTSDVIIRYCIVSDSGDEGIQLRAATNALVEYNYIHTTTGDSLSVCCDSEGAVIQYNELAGSISTNAALYLYDPPSGGTGLRALVYRNVIRDVLSPGNTGIYFGINGGTNANVGGTGGWIIENTISNINHDGIEVLHDGTLIQGNEFTNIAPTSSSAWGAVAFRENVDNVSIVNNDFHDNAFVNAASAAIYLPSGVTSTNRSATANNFVNNTPRAINNATGVSFDALGNWWGDASGPDDDAMVINGAGDAISIDVNAGGFNTAAETIESADSTIPEDPLSFGSIAPNTTLDMDVSVTNTATIASLVVTSPGLTFGGADPGRFSLFAEPTYPLVIAPGATATNAFTIRYDSGSTPFASHSALGTLGGTDDTPATVTLGGAALPVEISAFTLE